jgi:cobalt-zinc-cadmium resistance protein CzcA
MLERLMALSLRNRLVVGLAVLVIVGLGAYAIRTIPIDAFPDVTNIQVEVVSSAVGMSPLEIEQFVTYPIENAMRGLPGLVMMRSVTKYGLSVVTIVFRDDVDVYFARQQVHERLSEVERTLPEGVETAMGPLATAMGEIYQYTLESDRLDPAANDVATLTKLRTTQDWIVTPLLKGVPGVTEINSFGGYLQQYQVLVEPDKLLKYDLSVDAVADAIRNNNSNVGGNVVSRASEQHIIRGVGLIRTEDDIRKIVLKAERGTPVTIRDVGEVRIDHAIRQGASQMNGQQEVVGGIVMMLRGENSREVVKNVEAKVREINATHMLPDGVRIVPYYRRSEIVGKSISTVLKALAEGSVLALVILFLLLRSVRGALAVIIALPLSALLTFIVMRFTGLNANLMSLGGLAISIGMILDAAIIQVENVQRHLAMHPETDLRLTTVLRAAVEVQKPSIFGQLIIAVTFVPIATMQGMEGKMFSPLAYTVALALLSSLLLSVFVIPSLCLVTLRPVHKESPLLALAKRLYLPLLAIALRQRWVVVSVAAVSLVAAIAVVPRLGTEFVPVMDEGAFDMDVQLIPGVSLEQAMKTAGEVEQRLKQFPELETVVSRTGQTGVAIEARGVDKTGFVGALKPRDQWTTAHSREELIEKMRDSLADIPGMAFTFSQPIQCRIDELVAGTKAQVILKLFGDDTDVLRRKAGEIAAILGNIRGGADLVVERLAGQPYLTVTVDRDKVARYGVNTGDVLRVIELAIGGKPLSRLYQQNRVFDIALRFPEERRESVEALGSLLVDVPGGYRVPMNQLADLKSVEGPTQISRENGQRRIGIEMNVVGRDIGSFVKEAQQKIARNVELPPGYYLSWGGQFENQQQAMQRLTIITPIVVGLVFLLLLFTFDSVWLAGLVLVNLPFAMVGGVFALFLSGLYLSVPASVGFIVLFGVAVLNGVVLISYISDLRDGGASVVDAVRNGCEARLRPVLMTASISILSLIPMVFATGPGSEVQRPLAVVVIGGLVTSTTLTLLVLPTLYQWFAPERKEVEL